MPFLRVMHYNVQLLPSVPGSSSPGNEAEVRAGNVVDAIKGLSAKERPDVIAFSEVFSEDGRDVLLDELDSIYPNNVGPFDDCSLTEDSGLMLFSRIPLVTLPGGVGTTFGNKALFFSYEDSAGDDEFACKGVAVVQLRTASMGTVTIAFTHTQAFYDKENEHNEVRAKQLADVIRTISRVAGAPNPATWGGVILLGDLNVRGDPGAQRGEWKTVFTDPGGPFTADLDDGWRTYMRPPTLPTEVDPGYSVNNLDAGEDDELPRGLLMRLDYACFGKPGNENPLVPQHMRTRFRRQSDHWSLEADVHMRTPHCTPSDAVQWGAMPELPSGVRGAALEITFNGSYQWIYVDEPGTYSVFAPPGAEAAIYIESNLSDEWKPHNRLHVRDMGIDQLVSDIVRGLRTGEYAEQIDAAEPFFVRFRVPPGTTPGTGAFNVGVYRHTGSTIGSAIFLRPWEAPIDPLLPSGQDNGPRDECWFRIQIGSAFSGADHTSTLYIENATGNEAKAVVYDEAFNEVARDAGNQARLSSDYSTSGPAPAYMLLSRSSNDDTEFAAGWQSGLTYLRSVPSVRPMGLRCIDETGPDALGADEISLTLRVDGAQIFETYWDDADADEMLRLEGLVPEVAFATNLEVWAKEHDFISGPPGKTRIEALTPNDPLVKGIERNFDVESGVYRFECTLTRNPQ